MSDDDDLAALEKELGPDDDDIFLSVHAAMTSKEFLQEIAANKEPLVAIFADVQLSDEDCKTFGACMAKATRLEGVSFEAAVVSPKGEWGNKTV